MLLLPNLVDVTAISLGDFLILCLVAILAIATTFATLIILARMLRALLLGPEKLTRVSRVLAITVCAFGVWIVAAQRGIPPRRVLARDLRQ